MKLFFTYLILFFTLALPSVAGTLKGTVNDKQGSPVIGARVVLEGAGLGTVSGLDGSYIIKNIPEGKYRLTISYSEYNAYTTEITIPATETMHQDASLTSQKELAAVTVTGKKGDNTDNAVRNMEKNAAGVMNILSAQAIRLSPDITVANAVQRISGISVERSSNGDGQYAIVRGMDKRYNYTLVNGVKIPSPNDNYRYVPLDIFPADLLDRLEVYKSLTPSMEGDAVGGAVNMVMKDAPDHLTLSANVATGYNEMFMDRKFAGFDKGGVNWQSPYEVNGKSYIAKPADFSAAVIDYKYQHPAPNLVGGLSIGNRFWKNKLGVLLAGSYQNTYRGNNSLFFKSIPVDTIKGVTLTDIHNRYYSEQQTRLGTHAKIDLKINDKNSIKWYNAFISLNNAQVRIDSGLQLRGGTPGNNNMTYSYRSKTTRQTIYNSTLQGRHQLTNKLQLLWSGVVSKAKNEVPDNANIDFIGMQKDYVNSRTYPDDGYRRWQHNTDRDYAGYLDLKYTSSIRRAMVEWSIGGLYRDKQRSNFYNNYTLTPTAASQVTIYDNSYTNFGTIPIIVQNPTGSANNGQTYDSYEKIAAGYFQFKASAARWEAVGGVRAEHTNQGYDMLFPLGELRPGNNQKYTDLLPSLNLKYKYNSITNIRASYFRSVNRPGFSEIVPANVPNTDADDGYPQRGNADLKHAVADNLDLRYELFPRPEEQLLVGAFYKRIKAPIEYVLTPYGTHNDINYIPGNFGTANNYGLEIDYIKYFRNIGIKANYTFTQSSITTSKIKTIRNAVTGNQEPSYVQETRPMYGQSAHIGNIALLYRNEKSGLHGQIALNYTGPRINTVSQTYGNDVWQRGFVQLDASVEKTIRKHFVVYAKANNLLNNPMELFIKNTSYKNVDIPYQPQDGTTLIRRDYYQRNYMVGIRYQLK